MSSWLPHQDTQGLGKLQDHRITDWFGLKWINQRNFFPTLRSLKSHQQPKARTTRPGAASPHVGSTRLSQGHPVSHTALWGPVHMDLPPNKPRHAPTDLHKTTALGHAAHSKSCSHRPGSVQQGTSSGVPSRTPSAATRHLNLLPLHWHWAFRDPETAFFK